MVRVQAAGGHLVRAVDDQRWRRLTRCVRGAPRGAGGAALDRLCGAVAARGSHPLRLERRVAPSIASARDREARRAGHVVRLSSGSKRVRSLASGCSLKDARIDAGGLPVTWLEGRGRSAERDLAATAPRDPGRPRRVADGALAALAMHADPSAATALVTAARGGPSTQVRGQALFWVAQRAGAQAIPMIAERSSRTRTPM